MSATKDTVYRWTAKGNRRHSMTSPGLRLLAMLYVLDNRNLLNEKFLADIKKVEDYLSAKDENVQQDLSAEEFAVATIGTVQKRGK